VISPEETKQFVQLLAGHERGLYALIVSLVPTWADADEILQQTNVKLWENFDRFEPNTDFGAWARTIARYQVLTYRKQAARHRQPQFSEAFMELVTVKVEEHASDNGDARRLALSECLKRLNKKSQEMVRAYYAANGPNRLAAQLGRTVGSLRVAMFRIRRQLHECVEHRMKAEAR
jgi:RNA polymerase sigma-70 factor (ECF subfamily)